MFAYNTKQLEKKWSRAINLVESVKGEKMSAEKKGTLLHALENTAKRVAYKEATNPGKPILPLNVVIHFENFVNCWKSKLVG